MQTVGDSGGKEKEHNVSTNITAFAEQTRKQSVEDLSQSFMKERSVSPETFLRKADPVAFEQIDNGIRYVVKSTVKDEIQSMTHVISVFTEHDGYGHEVRSIQFFSRRWN